MRTGTKCIRSCTPFSWTRKRTFLLLKNTAECTLWLVRVGDYEWELYDVLLSDGFEFMRVVDEIGGFEGVELVDDDFLNKIFYVLAFLVLIIR